MTERAPSGRGFGFLEKLRRILRSPFQKPRLVFFRESWGGGMTGRHGELTVAEIAPGIVIITRKETGPGAASRESPVIAETEQNAACLGRIQQIFDQRVCRLLRYSPRIPFLILDKENRYYVFRWDNGREWSCDTGHFLTPGFREAIREINEAIIRAEESGNPGPEQISDSGDREL